MASAQYYGFASAATSHVGSVRKHNEDSWLDRGDIGLWVVADGMGGHQAGDVASRMIVESLGRLGAPADAVRFLQDVRTILGETNDRLLEEANRRGHGTVIGSTVVCLLAHGSHFACLWAGDSRLYRFRDGVLEQISRDHSQVQDMVDAGMLTAEEAESHPLANVITRAVGTQPDLVLDKVSDRLAANDIFLLCSDGLSKMVPDREVAAVLSVEPVGRIPDALIRLALAHGGKDNVTVIAVQVEDEVTVVPGKSALAEPTGDLEPIA
jgi:protein phosphatase/serine/threonine-protein phosphatase Stp1